MADRPARHTAWPDGVRCLAKHVPGRWEIRIFLGGACFYSCLNWSNATQERSWWWWHWNCSYWSMHTTEVFHWSIRGGTWTAKNGGVSGCLVLYSGCCWLMMWTQRPSFRARWASVHRSPLPFWWGGCRPLPTRFTAATTSVGDQQAFLWAETVKAGWQRVAKVYPPLLSKLIAECHLEHATSVDREGHSDIPSDIKTSIEALSKIFDPYLHWSCMQSDYHRGRNGQIQSTKIFEPVWVGSHNWLNRRNWLMTWASYRSFCCLWVHAGDLERSRAECNEKNNYIYIIIYIYK